MKKIIAAFDGLKYSTATRDYAIDIARQTNMHLTGIFLEDASYTGFKYYELIEDDGINLAKLKRLSEKDRVARQAAVEDFKKECNNAKIEFSVHRDHAVAIHELKHETVYADLLIINSSETLTHHAEELPTLFIKHLLGDVHCPVILVPELYRPIKKIISLYDGKPSSVHAMKMCSYLLPPLKKLPEEIVSVKPISGSKHLPDNRLMKELVKRHFPEARYTVLKGPGDTTILKHLAGQKQNTLITLGAYHRGVVSRWFTESLADTLMRETRFPLFIAHSN